MAFTYTYPAWATTPTLKYEALQRLEDKMITVHNRVGQWYTVGGVTQVQYNNLLPNLVKKLYAYTPQLSAANWKDFVKRYHEWTTDVHTEMFRVIRDIRLSTNPVDLDVMVGA